MLGLDQDGATNALALATAELRAEIAATVRHLETLQVSDLTGLLARTGEGNHA